MLTVLAIGGNALQPPDEAADWRGQVQNAKGPARWIAGTKSAGDHVIITHGNGPQIGALLLQNEMAAGTVAESPLDVLVAQSQAYTGYALQLAIENELRKGGVSASVLPIVTMVTVNPADPAFEEPSKPVGRIYAREEALALVKRGIATAKDPRGGYRRVVPSPEPLEIIGASRLSRLAKEEDLIPIVAGGGGIPVIATPEGLEGVEAVIDKDSVASLLATVIGADLLAIVTDVPAVYLDYGHETQQPLRRMTIAEARAYLREGQFPRGSMGPKIQAALRFLEGGGPRVVITDAENLVSAVAGQKGTSLIPGR